MFELVMLAASVYFLYSTYKLNKEHKDVYRTCKKLMNEKERNKTHKHNKAMNQSVKSKTKCKDEDITVEHDIKQSISTVNEDKRNSSNSKKIYINSDPVLSEAIDLKDINEDKGE